MRRDRLLHLAFEISVVAKGIDAVLEVIGGLLLLVVSRSQIHALVRVLTQHELSEDPRDFIANYLLHTAGHLSTGTQAFAAAYLLCHGAVKVGLVIGLLRRICWTYRVAIAAFVLFTIYQLYRYSHTRSPGLLALTVLDLIVIVLTWLEYRRLRRAGGFA
jgi:uncharacterized membrane protein